MLLIQLYLLICTLFLAGKDATSYQLKYKDNTYTSLEAKRIKRWHTDGVVLNLLFVVPFLQNYCWQASLAALLIRLAVFDIAFNKWAGLAVKHLGSTALVDQFFSKLFGQEGAVKKCAFFFLSIILLNIFKIL